MAFKMRYSNMFFLSILLVLFSCNRSTYKIFDEDGNLKQVKKHIDDDVWRIEEYYSNGVLKAQGKEKADVRFGEWTEWYSDGVEMWNGSYVDGEKEISIYQQTPKVIIKNNREFLRVDTLNAVKIIVEGLHPEDRVYVTDNGRITASLDDDAYNIYLVPERLGILRFKVYALRLRDDLFVGEIDMVVK